MSEPIHVEPGSLRSNLGLLGAGFLVRQLMVFIAVTYVAHRVGPEGFGLLGFSASLVGYFSLLATMGIPAWASRGLAQNPDRTSRMALVRRTFSARLMFSVVSCALAVALMPLLAVRPGMTPLYALYALNLIVGAYDPQWAFAGLERLGTPALAQVVGGVVELAMVHALVHGRGDLMWAAVSAVAAQVAVASVEIPWLKRRFGRLFAWPRRQDLGVLVRSTLPLALATALTQLDYTAGTVLLGYLKTPAQVGYYDAGYKFVSFASSTTLVGLQAVFPALSRLFQADRDTMHDLMRRAALITITFLVPMGVGGTFLAVPIVAFVYGPDFLSAAVPFALMVWAGGCTALALIYGNALVAAQGEWAYARILLWVGACSVALDAMLILGVGAEGAALAALISQVVLLVWLVGATGRRLGKSLPGALTWMKIALASAFMLAVVAATPSEAQVFLRVGAGVAAYGAAVWVLRILPRTV